MSNVKKCRNMKAGDTVFVRGRNMGTLSQDAEIQSSSGVEIFAILNFVDGTVRQCDPQQELEVQEQVV
jgi:hypothetical protein